MSAAICLGCGAPEGIVPRCGPASGRVTTVFDGDTIVLETGDRLRYLLIDTPETGHDREACWGAEAAELNRALVLDRSVGLEYDHPCTDVYGRLLAFVSVDGRSVNETLLARGYACLMDIPPAGRDRIETYRALEREARAAGRGLWSACDPTPCGG